MDGKLIRGRVDFAVVEVGDTRLISFDIPGSGIHLYPVEMAAEQLPEFIRTIAEALGITPEALVSAAKW